MKGKTKIVFIATLSILVFSLTGLFLLVNSLEKRNEIVAEERQTLENEIALMRSMQQVRRSVMSSVEEQEELSTFFINEDSIPYFLGTMEAVALQSNVDISISRVSLGGDRRNLGVAIRLTGDFADIHKYLKSIEFSPFRMTISRVFLQHTPEFVDLTSGETISRWSADVELTLLSYSEERLPEINFVR